MGKLERIAYAEKILCDNPADISEKFLTFIDENKAPYRLLAEPGPLMDILPIKEAKRQIKILQKFVKTFSEKEISLHNQHESDCYWNKCSFSRKKQYKPESIEYREYKPISGYVYFIAGKDEGNGTFKIGKAIDTKKRRRWLDVKLPFPCEVIHIIKSDDYSACEDYFHDLFNAKRKNGEWFVLTIDDIDSVKQIAVLNFNDTNNSTASSTTPRGVENE